MVLIVPILAMLDTAGIVTETVWPVVMEFIISSDTLTLIVTFDVSEILKGSFEASTVPASTLHAVT